VVRMDPPRQTIRSVLRITTLAVKTNKLVCLLK
jgi:hypothetical protein